jgi:hypothetical protein
MSAQQIQEQRADQGAHIGATQKRVFRTDGRRGTETLPLAENLHDRRLALGIPPLTVDCIGAKA